MMENEIRLYLFIATLIFAAVTALILLKAHYKIENGHVNLEKFVENIAPEMNEEEIFIYINNLAEKFENIIISQNKFITKLFFVLFGVIIFYNIIISMFI